MASNCFKTIVCIYLIITPLILAGLIEYTVYEFNPCGLYLSGASLMHYIQSYLTIVSILFIAEVLLCLPIWFLI